MRNKLLALFGLSCLATPLHAQEVSEFDALVEVMRDPIAEQFGTISFKTEPARIYDKPYLADDTAWERTARTDWYAAQLPANFSFSGNVSVLYLERCEPKVPWDDVFRDAERDDDFYRAADRVVILASLAANGIGGVDLSPLEARASWGRTEPLAGIRTVNAELQRMFENGKIEKRTAIFEPFCPHSQRGSYEQWVENGRKGPPPPPPPAPAPPPPPPPPDPIDFILPAGAKVWVTSELKSRICKVRTGSYYTPSCAWTEMLGSSLVLPGRYYRFRITQPGGAVRTGQLDLNSQPDPIDLTR